MCFVRMIKTIALGFLLTTPLVVNATGGLGDGDSGFKTEVKDYGYNFHEANNITPDIQTLTTDLFGDKIDPGSGSVSFEQTDISIPGNSGLPVAIRRTLSDPDSWFRETREFENWSLSIPHVRSTYITDKTGNYKTAYWPNGKACTSRLNSNPRFSTYLSFGGVSAYSQEYFGEKESYWNGDTISIPGQGSVKLTEKSGSYKRYNNRNWDVDCITNPDGTEGFKVTLDNGLIYTFSKQRTISSQKWFNLSPTQSGPLCGGALVPCVPESLGHSDPDERAQYPQYFIFMLATKIEDRFGNWVSYTYNTESMLTKITSNDSRTIDINYTGKRVSSITAQGKTWSYDYDDYRVKTLATVTRPDNKTWVFSHDKDANNSLWVYSNIGEHTQVPYHGYQCTESGTRNYIDITHPEGMQGSFILDEVCHGESNVFKVARPNIQRRNYDTYWIPKVSSLFSISSKTLTLTDGEVYSWNYRYSKNEGIYRGETIQAKHRLPLNVSGVETAHLKSTTITNPDNTKVVHYFDRRKGKSSGNLMFSENYDIDGSLLKRSTYNYADGYYHGTPQTYSYVEVAPISFTLDDLKNGESASQKQLMTQKVETFTDTLDTYTTTYSGFDNYDFPQTTHEYNNFNGKHRYTKQYYFHDTINWMFGLPARTTLSSNGSNYTEIAKTTYHSATGVYKSLPDYHYEMGRWYKRNTSYHTTGSNAGLPNRVDYNGASYNANSRWVDFSNYYRGKPRTITTPQSLSTASQVATLIVNNDGQVTKTTDFSGNCTIYDYNEIGRLKLIDPCDPTWLNTTIDYDTTSDSEGLNYVSAGMLKQTINRGNYQKISYFDSLLRTRLTQEWDKTSSSTKRFVRSDYDAFSRPVYQSLPSNSSTTPYGTLTSYDGLGRVDTIDNNTTPGIISHQYLPYNKVQVSDNKNNITTTTYLAYGSPSNGLATYIAAPHNTNTSLNYNLFDKLTSVSQGGITEHRVYDSYQNLCKTIRPDVGNTATLYNALDQIIWSARGSSISNDINSCDLVVDAADKTNYSFDNLGNIRTVTFSDGSPNKTYTYDKDSNLKVLVAGNVTTSYEYNSAKLLEKETLSLDGQSFILDYAYNSYGNLSSTKYPSGGTVTYSPNALGQATSVSNFASQATYHPNGAIKTHKYGNGYQHTTSLYSSGLPASTYDRIIADVGGCILCPISFSNTIKTVDKTESSINTLSKSTGDIGTNVVVPPGQEMIYAINHSYTYDANNNLILLDDKLNSAYDFSATYDGLDRLDKITDSYSGTGDVNYDAMGNISYYKIGPKILNYVYNGNKQLASTNGYKAFSFQYDDKGNIKHNGNRDFNYNAAEQMIKSGSNTYLYDGNNKRVKTVDSKGTSYSMYGSNGKLMYQKVNGNFKNYYYLGNKLVAKNGYRDIGTYIHADFLGSPAAETNSQNTNPTAFMHYEPFGEAIDAQQNDVGYTGHKFDTDLGLSYMQARYYDPVIGRFYSNDPVGYTAKNPVMSFNRYLYVNNNPYKYVDPNGEFLFTAIAVASVAYAAYSGYQDGGASGAVAEASGYNDAVDSVNAVMSGDFSGAAVSAASIVCKACKAGNNIKKNIKRFEKKLPANAKNNIEQKDLPGGGVAVQGTSDGKVPGSKAVYEKQIDSNGDTISYTKTTYDPDGNIVHVKDKITNEVYKNE